jgi:hypothetical protein
VLSSQCCSRTSHTAQTQESRTNYEHIFVSARNVSRMRNSSLERTWTVSNCTWMCVEGALCVILSFERFKISPTHNCEAVCVIHESAWVVYASSMRDYARDTNRPSVLMRRNWFETAHVHVRPLTLHVHITHEPRTYHVHSTDIHRQLWNVCEACVLRRAPSVIHASGVRQIFVEYCTVFVRMRRRVRYVSHSSGIVSDMCAVHA